MPSRHDKIQRRQRPSSPERTQLNRDTALTTEQFRQRTDLYFKPDRSQLIAESTVTAWESSGEQSLSAGYSHKKCVPGSLAEELPESALEYLKNRANEDITRGEADWQMVADGITMDEKNVCGLLGEAVELAAAAVIRELKQRTPPTETAIRSALLAIPEQARVVLANARAHSTHWGEVSARFDNKDFGTTVELVFYAPWLETAFVLHIGDSRTYHISAKTGAVEQIGKDHSQYYAAHGHSFITSYLSPDRLKLAACEVQAVPLAPGDRLVSVSDGAYGSETNTADLKTELSVLAARSTRPAEFAKSVVDWAHAQQANETMGFDDTSAAVLQRI